MKLFSRLPWIVPALLAALAAASRAQAQIKPGDQFPALGSAGLTGASVPDLAGKVVLVDFCASWCAPCRASFPVYTKLQAEYAAKGLVILAVSVDERPADYAAMVRKLHPGFVVVNDAGQKLVGSVQPGSMPTSYLLDRNGKVLAVHSGYHTGSTEKELRQELDRALAPASS
jgi:thiol-disulfide isomerase/thioredoxin